MGRFPGFLTGDSKMTQISLFDKKEDALFLTAYASLKQYNEPTTLENISAEKSRLDRVITNEYINDQFDIDYNQFVLQWLSKHVSEVIHTDIWTYDINIPDDAHELDVSVLVNKYQRKLAGSKY
nr:MAG: hypothetical protein [Caudoviricetes sp.]